MTENDLQIEIRNRLSNIEKSLSESRELLVGHLKVSEVIVEENTNWHGRRDRDCQAIADKLGETRSEFFKLKSLIEATTNKVIGAKTITAWAIMGVFGIAGIILTVLDFLARIKGK